MHSQCFGCYARCHSTLGARAYFFYVTKFLRIQCTRNSRDIYIYLYNYRDSASVESTRGGSLTLAPIMYIYIHTYICIYIPSTYVYMHGITFGLRFVSRSMK